MTKTENAPEKIPDKEEKSEDKTDESSGKEEKADMLTIENEMLTTSPPADDAEPEEEYVDLEEQAEEQATTSPEKQETRSGEQKTSNKGKKKKEKSEREESPKRKPKRTVERTGPKMTGSLHIKGFKRPLNQKKVRGTFETYGPVKYFWMSRNKQEGLVTFTDERHAYKCKNAMHDSFYPTNLPKHLAGKLNFTETDEATVQFTCEKGTKKNSRGKPATSESFG